MLILRTLSAFLFGSLVLAGSAQASTIVYTNDYNYNLKTVSVGQANADLMTYTLSGGANYARLYGYLPAESKITFTYTLTSLHAPTSGLTPKLNSLAELYAFGSYDYSTSTGEGRKKVWTEYYGESEADSKGNKDSSGYTYSKGTRTNTGSLVTTLANIDPKTGIGTTTIINNSSSKAFFLSELDVLKYACGQAAKIGYAVVSNVPLPGSLPLFAFAAGLLAFLSYRRKAQA